MAEGAGVVQVPKLHGWTVLELDLGVPWRESPRYGKNIALTERKIGGSLRILIPSDKSSDPRDTQRREEPAEENLDPVEQPESSRRAQPVRVRVRLPMIGLAKFYQRK